MTEESKKSFKEQSIEIITAVKEELKDAWTTDPVTFVLYAIVVLVVVVAILIGICEPGFEAHSFNKLTGGHASYWDALWVQLRIDCSNVIR